MTEEEYKKIIKEKDEQIKAYKKEIKILKEKIRKYKKEAYTDSLTKLNNRRSIENKVGFDAIILGDIDHFKKINDTYGHEFGDEILVNISKILKKYIRDSDLVCRWGGEEFIILLKNCNIDEAYQKATILKDKIEDLGFKYNITITMSFGISDLNNTTMQKAIKQADQAMYESKENGRNTITIYKLNNC